MRFPLGFNMFVVLRTAVLTGSAASPTRQNLERERAGQPPREFKATFLFVCVLTALTPSVRADTGLDGCLYVIDQAAAAWSNDQWRQEVQGMQKAGLRHLIITAPEATASRPTESAWQGLDGLMSASRGTDLRVYLSLWAHPIWYARWNLEEELGANRKVLDRLADRYGEHPNLAGWYIPHEIYVA